MGRCVKKASMADNPPADVPMPTTGKSFAVLSGFATCSTDVCCSVFALEVSGRRLFFFVMVHSINPHCLARSLTPHPP